MMMRSPKGDFQAKRGALAAASAAFRAGIRQAFEILFLNLLGEIAVTRPQRQLWLVRKNKPC
jgi:hypothetical protein